jgi:hypothetical protein
LSVRISVQNTQSKASAM